MNAMDNLYSLLGIINNIPNNTNETLCINDLRITLKKEDDTLKVEIDKEIVEESFDDSAIKEKVTSYKESIEMLDDETFLDILEDMKEVINIVELDSLLDLESYNEKDASRVEELLELSIQIIKEHLHNKIQDLMELYERF